MISGRYAMRAVLRTLSQVILRHLRGPPHGSKTIADLSFTEAESLTDV